jgi:hypothetical protein
VGKGNSGGDIGLGVMLQVWQRAQQLIGQSLVLRSPSKGELTCLRWSCGRCTCTHQALPLQRRVRDCFYIRHESGSRKEFQKNTNAPFYSSKGGPDIPKNTHGGEARCTTRLWVFGSLVSDWLPALLAAGRCSGRRTQGTKAGAKPALPPPPDPRPKT